MKLISVLNIIPYAIILLFNSIIDLLYPVGNNVYLTFEIELLTCFVYFLSDRLKNKYNKIISKGWIGFFILGMLNINSVNHQTNFWNLKIEGATSLYFLCMISFNISLLLFETFFRKDTKREFRNDLTEVTNSPFAFLMFLFPFLMFLDVFNRLGFIPIISGVDIVEDMYNYNYGPLYGFKFVCIYGFLFALAALMFYKKKYVWIIYMCLLFFIISIDGKRFLLLLCLISLIPVYDGIVKAKDLKISNAPIILSAIAVLLIYVFLNIVRSGSDFNNIFLAIIDKIPFGVEYKDFVHSFNEFETGSIPGYNFEMSAIGAFTNSSFLNFLGYDKNVLTHMGSAYTFMKVYNIDLGIRTGIVSELYFAYGYFVIPLMIIIAFFVNINSNKLLTPTSYFNLFQNSILFGLFFLLINGQATVFFGCLPMMIYIYMMRKLILIISPKGKL